MAKSNLATRAERLARPSVLLKRTSNDASRAGVWGGPGVVPAPKGPFRHWLSIDCRFLPAGLGPSRGVLSVYTHEEDGESGSVRHDPSAILCAAGGIPLYAYPVPSLPPPEALSAEDDEEYIRLWQSNCPLYTGEATAVLGGWHFPWPDGDWEELREVPFLVWTLEDAEPYVEVWGGPDAFRVMPRIT